MKRTQSTPDRQPTPPTVVHHANGLEFRVIPASSYDARMARDRHTLTMADGQQWTVGTRGGGINLAWRGEHQ